MQRALHRLRPPWLLPEDTRQRAVGMTLSIIPVHGIPEVRPRDDLVGLLLAAVAAAGDKLIDGDVLVVAQKVVSKSEGRLVRLADVTPGKRALEMAEESGKDPRQLEVVLGESKQIVRWERGVLIVETRHGFVCANAGVDRSNAARRSHERRDRHRRSARAQAVHRAARS